MLRNLNVIESQALAHPLPDAEISRSTQVPPRAQRELLSEQLAPASGQPEGSRPSLSARLHAHYRQHPAGYRRAGDYLMYLGLVLVVALSVYVFMSGN